MKNIFYKSLTLILLTPFYFTKASSTGGSGVGAGAKIDNPLLSDDIGAIVTAVANAAATLGISIAALFIVYSGYLFVSAKGNTGQLDKAKGVFFSTILGTAILLGAWVIARIIESTMLSLK